MYDILYCSCILHSIFWKFSLFIESKADEGSSINKRSEFKTKALAKAVLCFSPPLISAGYLSKTCFIFKSEAILSMDFSISSFDEPFTIRPNFIFSFTVFQGKRPLLCNMRLVSLNSFEIFPDFISF